MKESITYSPEFQRLLDLWHQANDSNDANVQYELARCLLKIKQKNTQQKAFALFKKLANQYYTTVQTDAQYMLALCYENGYGIGKSYPRAIRWYRKAADNITYDFKNNPDPVGDAFNETVENIVCDKSNIIEALDELDEYLFGEITAESMENMTEAAEYGNGVLQVKPKVKTDVFHTVRNGLSGKPFGQEPLGTLTPVKEKQIKKEFIVGKDENKEYIVDTRDIILKGISFYDFETGFGKQFVLTKYALEKAHLNIEKAREIIKEEGLYQYKIEDRYIESALKYIKDHEK